MWNKSLLSIEICLAVICCMHLCGSTVEAYCSANQNLACIRDATKVLSDFINNPQASKIPAICESQRRSWACLNSHNCDVSASEPAYRSAMDMCNGNIRASDVNPGCADTLDCVRDASNVLSEFVRNPQYNAVGMRRLCNTQRDMRNCLRANNCILEAYETTYRRTMQQCNSYFRGGYPDGSSSNRTKRSLAFGGALVQPLFEGASSVLLSYTSAERK